MDPDSSILGSWELWLLLGLLFASAFFSASESALLSVNRLRLRTKADEGNSRAQMLSALLESPNRFIAAILIGNNVVNIAASALATVLAINLWGSAGPGIATAFMTVTVITFGEIIPKSLATRFADTMALRITPVIHFLTRVLGPFVTLFDGLSTVAAKLVGGEKNRESQLTEQEIHTLIRLGQEEGVLDEYEHSLIRSVFDFGDTTAEEIMVPRIDMIAVPLSTTMAELGALFADNPFNRLPVYDETLDTIVGAVHLKDYIRHANEADLTVDQVVRPVLFVPETLTIETLFARMKRQRISTAIVLDEYGQTVGLITPSDITEEIVGRFMDEHDAGEEHFVALKEGAIEVDGGYLIEDINSETDFDLPTDIANTIGGFIFFKLGRVPKLQDRILLTDNVEAVVLEMNGKRVAKVRLIPVSPVEPPAEPAT